MSTAINNDLKYQKIDSQQETQANTEKTDESDNGLGKDAFLKLLVTQLKYQNPMKPMEDKEFISQMAQFSSLEQMNNLNETMTKSMQVLNMNILGMVEYQKLSEASNLVGKEVVLRVPTTAKETDNKENTENSKETEETKIEYKTIKGQVDKVKLTNEGPKVVIDDKEYSINNVTEILA